MKEDRENIQGSLLDSLTGGETLAGEARRWRETSFAELEASVRRDLENLLNTKCFAPPLPSGCPELARSLFVYGVADFTSRNPKTPGVRTALREEIERAITLFEPRLKSVTVRVEPPSGEERTLKFKISALLRFDPVAEPVTFDTYFDPNKGEYTIRK